MPRYRFHDKPMPMFPTRDVKCGRETSTHDAANLVAAFAPGHTARAAEGGGLSIHAASGAKVATFHAPGHHATTDDDGTLHIYRSRTDDSQITLRDLNRINEAAFQRRLT